MPWSVIISKAFVFENIELSFGKRLLAALPHILSALKANVVS